MSLILCHKSFHTFLNHSKEGHRLGNQLDHLGIVIVIWGSAIPSDYFGFYCNQNLRFFYWAMVYGSALHAVFISKPDIYRPRLQPPAVGSSQCGPSSALPNTALFVLPCTASWDSPFSSQQFTEYLYMDGLCRMSGCR